MQKIIGVTELQRRFRSVFDEVSKENVPYVLTRGSRPEAALISYEEFERLQELGEQELRRRVDAWIAEMSMKNVSISDEEVMAEAEAVREELYNARRP